MSSRGVSQSDSCNTTEEPHQTKAKGSRAKGARNAMVAITYEIVTDDLRKELDDFGRAVYARKTVTYSKSLGET
jgi:hypothetical protein